jgi:hypothetical protein
MRNRLLLAATGSLALAFSACSGDDNVLDDGGAGTGGASGATSGGKGEAAGGKAGSGTAGSAGKGGNSGGSGGSGSSGAPGTGGGSAGTSMTGTGGTNTAGTAGTQGGNGAGGGAGGAVGGSSASGGAGGTDTGGDAGMDGSSGGGGDDSGGSSGASSAGTSGGGSGGTGGGTLDPFGIREIYPTAPGGAEWTSEHWEGESYEISGREDSNDPSGLSGMRGDGSLEVDDGVLTMSGSQPRIYIYEPDSGPWQNVEVTAYYQRIEDDDQAYAGLVMGVRSGADGHTTDGACDAHTYYARVRNDGAFDFEKELEHPASSTQSRVQPDDAWPDGEVPRETWIGFKFVIYNLDGGDVKFEAYRDMTNGEDGGDWELVNETIDDGGWFVESSCSEHSPSGGESDLVVTEGGTTFIRNTDVQEALYRWVSVREIEAP